MTEQMAIEKIKAEACSDRLLSIHCDDSCLYGAEKCEWAVAIQALEEIKQYRAIGTVEELQYAVLAKEELERRNKYLVPVVNKERYELEQYRKCGTVEEFKALKEKAEPKKIIEEEIKVIKCPSCGSHEINNYCSKCGQLLDWE